MDTHSVFAIVFGLAFVLTVFAFLYDKIDIDFHGPWGSLKMKGR